MSRLPGTDSEVISFDEPKLLRFRDARSCAFRVYDKTQVCAVDRRFAHCLRFVEAGLYDEHGKLIQLSERQGGLLGEHNLNVSPLRLPVDIFNKDQRRIAGRSIFLGFFMGHYGHFITETLSRCWSLASYNTYDHYIFYKFMFKQWEVFHDFFLQSVGIPREKILFLDAEAIFDDIDVPEQLWIMNGRGNAALTQFYARFGARPRGSRRLFLSLDPSGPSLRSRLANMGEVEDIFREYGFEILYPEALDPGRQMEAYNNAAILAGFSGSALHNCIFAPRGCQVIEIGDTRSPKDYLQPQKVANALVAAKACHFAYVEGSAPRSISGEHVLKELKQIVAAVPRTEISRAAAAKPLPKHLKRSDVLNHILSLFHNPSYLEIGVNSGETFFAVEAGTKVAVDPQFLFDVDEARGKIANARFHSVESDAYFSAIVGPDERFDVIYLDGLHTVEQTLRDFCNAISYLKESGIIVIDDVVPNSYHASLPDLRVSRQLRDGLYPKCNDGSWMGDVYRLVFFIQTFFQQYRYATVVENHGQLVVWKERRSPKELAYRGLQDIGRLPFENTVTESAAYNKLSFREILSALQNTYEIRNAMTNVPKTRESPDKPMSLGQTA
jgi:capsular polysaccharide biosynthesis protein